MSLEEEGAESAPCGGPLVDTPWVPLWLSDGAFGDLERWAVCFLCGLKMIWSFHDHGTVLKVQGRSGSMLFKKYIGLNNIPSMLRVANFPQRCPNLILP